jgi:dihydroorotate dehydrogenase (NAD+) catalytic subunit
MADLSTRVGPLALANPILTASGCAGYGEELGTVAGFDMARLGGFLCKSISREPMPGNPPPRVTETPGGMLNSIGLQNGGLAHFIAHDLPGYRDYPCPVIGSIFGNQRADYIEIAQRLEAEHAGALAAVELNISCPNTEHGGLEFGAEPAVVESLVRDVRAVTALPLIVKLSPNVTDIREPARAAAAGGADALTVSNTFLGTGINWKTRRSRLHRGVGGLSGPAVKPLVLFAVQRVRRALPDMPILASGGAKTADDVLEFAVAGADAVQVGTAAMVSPMCLNRLVDEIAAKLDEAGIARWADLIGTVIIPAEEAARGA